MQEVMQPMSIGETLRQMRRQQSLTQSELGGEHFSKSYISAVERDKIVPSYEALHFFAEQLGQPRDYFEGLLSLSESSKSTPALIESEASTHSEQLVQEKILPLLDTLLMSNELYARPFPGEFSPLDADVTATLSADIQGRYAFLLGLIAQQKEDYSTALGLLEQALTQAPGKYRPAILDTLGTNYYYVQSYYVAIDYHERALVLLKELEAVGTEKSEIAALIALRLKVEYHCGNDYHALGAHKQAREHFEQARQRLRAEHDIKTAAQLYLKLGYCIYADVYHHTSVTYTTTIDEIEREFGRAVSYFVQSRTLYQVSSERIGEVRARLSQVMVLLDLSTRRRQVALDKSNTIGKIPPINSTTILADAEEQCRQILLGWEPDNAYPTAEIEILLYTALAYYVRVHAQRAMITVLNGYDSTATRECSVATCLCQKIIDTFGRATFPWMLMREMASLQDGSIADHMPMIPRIPDVLLDASTSHRQDMSRSVVLFAIGEVMEVLGYSATQEEYAQTCYERANESFRASLDAYHRVSPTQGYDRSYLYRVYQRCIEILEERKQVAPNAVEQTNNILVDFLKDALRISYTHPL